MAQDIRGFDDALVPAGPVAATPNDPEGDDLMRTRPDYDPQVTPDRDQPYPAEEFVPPDGIPITSDQPDVEPALPLIQEATPTRPRMEYAPVVVQPPGVPIASLGACPRCGETVLLSRATHEDTGACLAYVTTILATLRREHAELEKHYRAASARLLDLQPIADRIASIR